MTRLEFITQFTTITNDLLQAGITGCNIHETRQQLDWLFDKFEEYEGSDGVDFDFEDVETKKERTPFNSIQFFNSLASGGMFGLLVESECD